MSMALTTTAPSRQELEALTLADRVALEDAFGEAHELIRGLNDAEIRLLAEAGASQRAIATAMGVTGYTARARLAALGLATDPRSTPRVEEVREEVRASAQHVPQNGEVEVVDAEVVPEPNPAGRPAHYLPDVVDPDAERNLRTQALHWFEQGRHLEELLNEGVTVEPRDRPDRDAIKREAAEMVRIARLLKGATRGR